MQQLLPQCESHLWQKLRRLRTRLRLKDWLHTRLVMFDMEIICYQIAACKADKTELTVLVNLHGIDIRENVIMGRAAIAQSSTSPKCELCSWRRIAL